MNARVPPPPADAAPAAGAGDLKRALGRDLAQAFKPLGIETFRAFAVDLQSMNCDIAWLVSESGDFTEDNPERRLDSALPGAMNLMEQLVVAGVEQVLVHKLSHRRWAYAWRVDERLGLIAEACYREGRPPQGELDSALVRLICDAGIRASGVERLAASARKPALDWVAPAPRKSRSPKLDNRSRIGLSLIAASALLSAALALVAVPHVDESVAAVQTEVAHWRRTADRSMQRSLSVALASGDYGEVQDALGGLSTSGYFRSALVTNARGRVVAVVGPAPGQQIGNELQDSLARTARPLDLSLANQALGRVLILTEAEGATGADSRPGLNIVRALAALAAVAAAAAGLVLSWPRLQGRRSGG